VLERFDGILYGYYAQAYITSFFSTRFTVCHTDDEQIVGLVSQALFSVSTVHGAGAHVTSLPFPEIGVALKYTYLSIFVGVYAVIFAKWAIIALLLQVRGPHHYKRRMFLWSLGILTGLLGTLQLIMMLTQCVHIDQLWNVLEVRNCPRTAAVMKLAYA